MLFSNELMFHYDTFQVASHKGFEELWIEEMMTVGLPILLDRMSPESPLPVWFAAAEAISTLATHKNLALLLIDHGLPVITSLQNLNSDCRVINGSLYDVYEMWNMHRVTFRPSWVVGVTWIWFGGMGLGVPSHERTPLSDPGDTDFA